jgi:glycosyltransferase involved in cell wall biosynthesis
MGSNTTPEDMEPEEVNSLIQELALEPHLCWTGDLPHEQFLTILSYASVFIRTPICDGVCSSVLEALALGKAVVASENPHRPPGVLTFKAGQSADLADKVRHALNQSATGASQQKAPEVPDTVADEARFLLHIVLGKGVPALNNTLWSSSTHAADD